jgi:hypothetical protein
MTWTDFPAGAISAFCGIAGSCFLIAWTMLK